MKTMSQKCILVSVLMIWLMMGAAAASMEEQEKECAEELTNLASCIPFVSGTAKKPTAECCEQTKRVKEAKPKCLCVLIKESTDPSLGLPVNTSLALQMPSSCNIDAKVSDCPSLLNLSPDSPEAKIFKAADSSSSTSPPQPPSSSSSSTTSPPHSDSKTTTPDSSNGSNPKAKSFGEAFLAMMALAASAAMISI